MNPLPFLNSMQPKQKSTPSWVPLLFFMNVLSWKPCLHFQAPVWFSKCYALATKHLVFSYLAT
jgi:hypothetical protein